MADHILRVSEFCLTLVYVCLVQSKGNCGGCRTVCINIHGKSNDFERVQTPRTRHYFRKLLEQIVVVADVISLRCAVAVENFLFHTLENINNKNM